MDLIQQVLIDVRGNIISAEVIINENQDLNLKYAFYLLLDGRRVDKVWYGASNKVTFSLPKESGALSVMAFVDTTKEKVKKESETFYLGLSGEKREIRLKEWSCNSRFYRRPSDEYLSCTEGIKQQDFCMTVDKNGFISSKHAAKYSESEKWFFYGDSFIESMFVQEGKRFNDCLQDKLNQADKAVQVFNGGISGISSLQIFNAVLNKTVPLGIDKLVVAIPGADLRCVGVDHSYWNSDERLSPVLPTLRKNSKKLDDFELKSFFTLLHLFKALSISEGFELYFCTIAYRRWSDDDEVLKRIFGSEQVFNQSYFAGLYFNKALKEWCEQESVKLIDLDSDLKPYRQLTYDALHLNEQGSEEIADLFYKQLIT